MLWGYPISPVADKTEKSMFWFCFITPSYEILLSVSSIQNSKEVEEVVGGTVRVKKPKSKVGSSPKKLRMIATNSG